MLIFASVLATIIFEPPVAAHVEQLEVVQVVAPDHVRVTLAFTLLADHDDGRELPMVIDVPRGAQVVGLTLDRKNDEMAIGDLLPTVEARRTYNRLVGGRTDPALLEWQQATSTHDRYHLRVFPLSVEAPARLTIEVITNDPIALESKLQPTFTHRRTKDTRPKLLAPVSNQKSLIAIEPAIARAFRRAACAGC
jgi:hypothetical protein